MIRGQLRLEGLKEAKTFVHEIGKSGPFITSHMINGMLPKTRKFLGTVAKAKLSKGSWGSGAETFTAKTALKYDKALIKKNNVGRIYWDKDAFYMEEVIRTGTKRARNNYIAEPTKKSITNKFGNIRKNFQQQVGLRRKIKRYGPHLARKTSRYLTTSGKQIPLGNENSYKKLMLITPEDYRRAGEEGPKPGIYRRRKAGKKTKLTSLIVYRAKMRQQNMKWNAGKDAVGNFNRLAPAQFRKSYAYWNKRRRR